MDTFGRGELCCGADGSREDGSGVVRRDECSGRKCGIFDGRNHKGEMAEDASSECSGNRCHIGFENAVEAVDGLECGFANKRWYVLDREAL